MLGTGNDGRSPREAEGSTRGGHAGRSRWHRVRVETDEGTYLGSLRLNGIRPTLHDALEDGRAYLALWDARHEPSGVTQDFVVLHKGTIRQVAVLGRADPPAASREWED